MIQVDVKTKFQSITLKSYIYFFNSVLKIKFFEHALVCDAFTKNRDKDVSFYNLPKDKNLRKKWLTNIKRENIPKNPKICHQHFEDSCFKMDLEVNIFPLLFTNLFILYINK